MTVTIDTEAKTMRPNEPATLAELAKLEGLLRANYGDVEWKVVGKRYPPFFWQEEEGCAPTPVPSGGWDVSTTA